MTEEIKRCPVCLGSGRTIVPDVAAHGKHHLIPKKLIEVTCAACHGTGRRPEWMNDPRGRGADHVGCDHEE